MNALKRMLAAMVVIAASFLPVIGQTGTQQVGGYTWYYTVANGEATIEYGNGSWQRAVEPAQGGGEVVATDLVDFTVTELYAQRSVDLNEALDNRDLAFVSGGPTGWAGQSGVSHDGIAAAASGFLDYNETNTLSTTVSGKGVLSFWWKTDDGDGLAEMDLALTVDGRTTWLGKPSSAGDGWLNFALTLTNDGPHTVTWSASVDSTEYNEWATSGWEMPTLAETIDLYRSYIDMGLLSLPGAWIDQVAWAKDETVDVVKWGDSSLQAKRFLPGSADEMIAKCDARIAKDASDYEAYVRRAITRIKKLGEDEVFAQLLARYGYEFSGELMAFVGELDVTDAPLSNDAVDTVAAEALPALADILTDLETIPEGWTGCVALSPEQYPVDESVYVDFADIVLAKAAVHGAKAAILAAQGYDLTFDNQKMYEEIVAASNKETRTVAEFTGDWAVCPVSRMKGFGADGFVQLAAKEKKLLVRLTLPTNLPPECATAEYVTAEFELANDELDSLWLYLDLGEGLNRAFVSGILGLNWLDLTEVGVVQTRTDGGYDLEIDLSAIGAFRSAVGMRLDEASVVWGVLGEEVFYGETYQVVVPVFELDSDGSVDNLTVEAVLDAHPQCVAAIRDQTSLTASKGELRSALELYGKFDAAIRSRTSGKMHFFEYDTEDAAQWNAVADAVKKAITALDEIVTVKGEDYACFKNFKWTNLNERVTFKPFFDGKILRSLLPPFEGDRPVLSAIPDITFAGTFPDWTMANQMYWLEKIDGVWYDVPPQVDPVEPVVTYTITYLGLEGAVNTNVTQFATNGLPLALGPVEREGWRFLGWTPWDGVIPVGTASNVTFTALWEALAPVNPDEPGVIVDPEPKAEDVVPVKAEEVTSALSYNGYLAKGDEVVGSVTVKVAKKAKVTATVQLPDGSGSKALKKFSYAGTLGENGSVELSCKKNGGTMSVTIGAKTISGTVTQGGETYVINGRLGTKEELSSVDSLLDKKVWTVALHTPTNGVPHPLVNGYSVLTVTGAKKGKVKVSGFMADGTKVSVTAQGTVFDSCVIVPVNAALYKGKAGGFSLKLKIEGEKIEVGNVSDWMAVVDGKTVTVQWDAAPASAKTDIGSGAAFGMDAADIPFDNVVVASADGTSTLPSGVKVDSVGGKWSLPKAGKVAFTKDKSDYDVTKFGENPAGLKLSYAAKTGAFKGSFSLYRQTVPGKLKKEKATVNGAVVNGVGYGSAVIKNTGSMPVTVGAGCGECEP